MASNVQRNTKLPGCMRRSQDREKMIDEASLNTFIADLERLLLIDARGRL